MGGWGKARRRKYEGGVERGGEVRGRVREGGVSACEREDEA